MCTFPKTTITIAALGALFSALFTAFLSAPVAAATGPRTAIRAHQPVPLGTRRTSLLAKAIHDGLAPRTKKGTLDYPYGLAVDSRGYVYVTNIFAGVNVYNPKLQYVTTITSGVSTPAAVAISSNGNVSIANNSSNSISMYNSSFTQIGTIADSTLANPESMFIDADDTTWVLDALGTLHSYLTDGTALPSALTGGSAVGPWGPNVTVWGITNASGGHDEAYENRGEADHYGVSLFNVFANGSPYAGGETQNSAGEQFVTDITNNNVQIWSANGAYLVGLISTPSPGYGIAVDAHNRVYVAITSLNCVYVYAGSAPFQQLAIIH